MMTHSRSSSTSDYHTARDNVERIDLGSVLQEGKLYFDLVDPDLPMGRQRIRSRSYVVDPTPELMRGVTRLFGRDNVVLEGEA